MPPVRPPRRAALQPQPRAPCPCHPARPPARPAPPGLYDSITTARTERLKVDYSADPLMTDAAFRHRIMADICRTGLAIEQALGSAQVGGRAAGAAAWGRRRNHVGARGRGQAAAAVRGAAAAHQCWPRPVPALNTRVRPSHMFSPSPATHPRVQLQDIEGVVDPDGRITVVQTRPQM